MLNFTEAIPLSLYIHLPWCVKKCPYCDFNSHELIPETELQKQYIDAVIRDLETELPNIWGRQIISVFIGGGTPSLFSVDAIDYLLSACRSRLNLHPQIEMTMEANPGTAEADKFAGFRDIGINRLSIGVQSFQHHHLTKLGRIHNGEEAIAAINMTKAAGFINFNIDLMFGLPEQTLAEALSDLQQAIALTPTHISWYQLTIEPNTFFHSRPPSLPDEDYIYEMQNAGQEMLAHFGYQQYEISAYAKDNNRCEHNLNYWEFGDYLGIGAGAHGKLTMVSDNKVLRTNKHKLPKRYIELAGQETVRSQTNVTKQDIAFEFMLNAMRLKAGVSSSLFRERTGLPLSVIDREMNEAESKNWLECNIHTIKPTAKGQRYLNDLLELFLPE